MSFTSTQNSMIQQGLSLLAAADTKAIEILANQIPTESFHLLCEAKLAMWSELARAAVGSTISQPVLKLLNQHLQGVPRKLESVVIEGETVVFQGVHQ